MADPLSITASVITLIQVSVQVTVLIKQFRDEVSVVDVTLSGLLNDVEGFQQVLESMKETFNQDDVKANLQETGHAGSHYRNLARSLNDGNATLNSLHELLDSINKKSNFLDGPRKQIRFKSATDQIATYREQIQSYRAGMQLSLSTVILWNQVTFQKNTEQIPERILPNLDKLYDAFRVLGSNLNAKIEKLQSMVSDQSDRQELKSMNNLRDCVRSAADVVSTASTTLTAETSDKVSVKYGSDFGDIFTRTQNETMQRWMSSNTVYEFEDLEAPMPVPSESSLGDAPTEYQSDSDSDIENEMIRALLNNGLKRKEQGDLTGAERHFKNCLTRLSTSSSVTSLSSAAAAANSGVSKAEVLEHLTQTYCLLKAWAKAKTTMMEKLHITERQVGKKDERFLQDTMKLAEVMMNNKEFGEAHLQARRALRGFKKLGEPGYPGYEQCLRLLMHLSKEEGKADEEEGYSALLGSHLFKLKRAGSIPQPKAHVPPELVHLSESFSSEISTSKSVDSTDEAAPSFVEDRASTPKAREPTASPSGGVTAEQSIVSVIPQARSPSGDTSTKAAIQMPYPPAAESIARKSASPGEASPKPLNSRREADLDEVLANRLQELEYKITHHRRTSSTEKIGQGNDAPVSNPKLVRNALQKDLQEQLDDLRIQQETIANVITDIHTQVYAGPSMADMKLIQTLKQKKAEHREVMRKIHDCENELTRVVSTHLRTSSGIESSDKALPNSLPEGQTNKDLALSGTAHSNVDEKLARQIQEREETLALKSNSALPLLRSENPDEALARRLQREEYSSSNQDADGKVEDTSSKEISVTKPPVSSATAPSQSASSFPGNKPSYTMQGQQSSTGDKENLHSAQASKPALSAPKSDAETGTVALASATLSNAASFLQELPSITIIPAVQSNNEMQEDAKGNDEAQDTSLRRSASDSRLSRPIEIGDTLPARSPLDTVGVSARSMQIAMNSELSERFDRLQRNRPLSSSTLAPPEPVWSVETHDDEADGKEVVRFKNYTDKEVALLPEKDKIPDWVGHTREEVHAAMGHGRSIARPGWNLDKTISRDDPYAKDPYTEAKIDITPSCPICSASLSGLSDTAASTHVNSCMDGKPIAVSKLREMDKGRDQEPNLQHSQNLLSTKDYSKADGGVPSNSLPTGTWACCNCKSLELRFMSETHCPTCGHMRDVTCPSSGYPTIGSPAVGVTYIAANLGPVQLSQGQRIRRKLLILGDTMVGKTWLIQSWYKGQHPKEGETFIFDNFVKEVNVEGINVDLAAWDNICAEGYENLRRLSYDDAHVLLICFDLTMSDSLDNVTEAWNAEAEHRLKGVPKILVGCKSDLRVIKEAAVPWATGENVARRIGALAYWETSAIEKQNVAELFQYAAKVALVKNAPKQKKGIRRFLSRSDIKFRPS